MMNDILIKKKYENILVYSCVFWALFNFAYNFTTFTGGGPGPVIVNYKLNFVLEGYITFLLFFFFIGRSGFSRNHSSQSAAVIVACGVAVYFMMHIVSIGYFIEHVFFCVMIFAFLQLRDNVKYRIFDGFAKCLGVLVFFSIIEYLVYLFFDLRIVVFPNVFYVDLLPGDLTLFNFMHQPTIMSSVIGIERFYRFQSFTNEPGSLGTTAALLLFAIGGNKRYRFEYITFWIAGIMTLSMAFYLLAMLHLICSNYGRKRFVLLLCLGFIFAYIYIKYSDFFESIFSQRLKETGDRVDNRASVELQKRLEQAWDDGSVWLGRGNADADVATGAGVKLMLYQYGIIGVVILVMSYIYSYILLLKSQHLRKVSVCIVFFFAFWINFYQRSDIFLFQYIIPYFCLPAFMKYYEVQSKMNLSGKSVKRISAVAINDQLQQ